MKLSNYLGTFHASVTVLSTYVKLDPRNPPYNTHHASDAFLDDKTGVQKD